MTEEISQELKLLLSEVMKDVDIRSHSGENFMSMAKYIEILRARRQSYRPDLADVLHYCPHIQNDSLKSRLLGFVKEEFSMYIRDDIPGYPRLKQASLELREGGYADWVFTGKAVR